MKVLKGGGEVSTWQIILDVCLCLSIFKTPSSNRPLYE